MFILIHFLSLIISIHLPGTNNFNTARKWAELTGLTYLLTYFIHFLPYDGFLFVSTHR
jgi:hypothetical protein